MKTGELDLPTAVYFPRMWTIMITVIISATICTKDVAVVCVECGQPSGKDQSGAGNNNAPQSHRPSVNSRNSKGKSQRHRQQWVERAVQRD